VLRSPLSLDMQLLWSH